MNLNVVWVIIVVLLVFAFIGAPGIGPYQHSYGYYPSGLFGIIVVVLLILLLMGKL